MPKAPQLLIGILIIISGAVLLLQSFRDRPAPDSKEFIPSAISPTTRRFAGIGGLIAGILIVVGWYFGLL